MQLASPGLGYYSVKLGCARILLRQSKSNGNLLAEASNPKRTILGKFCYTIPATTTTNHLLCTSVQDFIKYYATSFIPLLRPSSRETKSNKKLSISNGSPRVDRNYITIFIAILPKQRSGGEMYNIGSVE